MSRILLGAEDLACLSGLVRAADGTGGNNPLRSLRRNRILLSGVQRLLPERGGYADSDKDHPRGNELLAWVPVRANMPIAK
jgi:hypothetical protein